MRLRRRAQAASRHLRAAASGRSSSWTRTWSPLNINRQAIAFESTVSKRKVDVMAAMIADINPSCRVFAHDAFVLAENLVELYEACLEEMGDHIDYVDAIDTVSPSSPSPPWPKSAASSSSAPWVSQEDPSRVPAHRRRAQDGQLLARITQGMPQARHPPSARPLPCEEPAHRRRPGPRGPNAPTWAPRASASLGQMIAGEVLRHISGLGEGDDVSAALAMHDAAQKGQLAGKRGGRA
ncbi:MAG: ThiF family adenylyltransferase [Collinsella aerofaciens]